MSTSSPGSRDISQRPSDPLRSGALFALSGDFSKLRSPVPKATMGACLQPAGFGEDISFDNPDNGKGAGCRAGISHDVVGQLL